MPGGGNDRPAANHANNSAMTFADVMLSFTNGMMPSLLLRGSDRTDNKWLAAPYDCIKELNFADDSRDFLVVVFVLR